MSKSADEASQGLECRPSNPPNKSITVSSRLIECLQPGGLDVRPRRHLRAVNGNLNKIRWCMNSQCNAYYIGVAWSRHRQCRTSVCCSSRAPTHVSTFRPPPPPKMTAWQVTVNKKPDRQQARTLSAGSRWWCRDRGPFRRPSYLLTARVNR